MRIIELSRSYCRTEYNGDFQAMIDELDGIVFDDETTRRAFAFGKGTEKDLQRYINDNRKFCKYYDLEKQCYI